MHQQQIVQLSKLELQIVPTIIEKSIGICNENFWKYWNVTTPILVLFIRILLEFIEGG